MATIPVGTTVTFVNLPKDHPALANGNHAVIQAASISPAGALFYWVKTHLGAQAIFQVPAANVLTTGVMIPPLPLPGVQSGYTIPGHHSPAP
jgi:hypothetical protein